jgi:hypothetical protein
MSRHVRLILIGGTRALVARALLTLAVIAIAAAAASAQGLRDANCDGMVDEADRAELLRLLFADEPTPCAAADINRDGRVSAADLIAFASGPRITYLGIASPDGQAAPSLGQLPDGALVYFRNSGFGFLLVVEATLPPDGADIGTSTFDSDPRNPFRRPDFQILVDRKIGDGSRAVCDEFGVPASTPPDFAYTQAVSDSINDLACRFEVATTRSGTCTQDEFGQPNFVAPASRAQFCVAINGQMAFGAGDTRISVQIRDRTGLIGPMRQMILRVENGPMPPTFTPAPPTSTPTATDTASATATATLTPTPSVTRTSSRTPTPSVTRTSSRTPTRTATVPFTSTPLFTPTAPSTPTAPFTNSPTRTRTRTPTVPTATATHTATGATPTATRTPSGPISTATQPRTATSLVRTVTGTPRTPTRTATPSPTALTGTVTRTLISLTRTITRTATRTAVGPSPTRTATRTLAGNPTPTATPTLAASGPVVTFLGLTLANDMLLLPAGMSGDIPIYQPSSGAFFSIVVEAKPGASHVAVGTSTFNDPSAPDLQIQVTRALGNGSATVCDDTPPILGGVPAINPPTFSDDQSVVDRLNDLACRFIDGFGRKRSRTCSSEFACVLGTDGEYGCIGDGTTAQFCGFIPLVLAFPAGDTLVTVRVRDAIGNLGPPKQLIMRIQ